jgi:hypothetical protein
MQEEVDMLEMQEVELSKELELARKATSVQAFRTEVFLLVTGGLEAFS